jgi:Holliday junction resolvase
VEPLIKTPPTWSATSRAPKQLGDFGEGLVTYLLFRNGYEVAVVDHVGADLIAQKGDQRFAISVKTRLFRAGSKESRSFVIAKEHLEKLEHFANSFRLESLFAQVVCLEDEKTIHVCILSMDFIRKLNKTKHEGYALRMQRKSDIERLSEEAVLYVCFHEN